MMKKKNHNNMSKFNKILLEGNKLDKSIFNKKLKESLITKETKNLRNKM